MSVVAILKTTRLTLWRNNDENIVFNRWNNGGWQNNSEPTVKARFAQQSIIDSIVEKLDTENYDVKCISLIANETNLRERLTSDVECGIRTTDVIDRSVARISLYQTLDTIKIDTSNKTVRMIVDEITQL